MLSSTVKLFYLTLFIISIDVSAKEYKLNFSRKYKKGQQVIYDSEVNSSQDIKVFRNGKLLRRQKILTSINVKGTLTADNVSSKGNVLEASLKVKKGSYNIGKGKVNLAKNTIFSSRIENDKSVFFFQGKKAQGELIELLRLLIPVSRHDVNDAEILGVNREVSVGERWPIHKKILEKVLNDSENPDIKVVPNTVDGEVKLANIVKVKGAECAHIEGNFSYSLEPFKNKNIGAEEVNALAYYNAFLPVEKAGAIKTESKFKSFLRGKLFAPSGKPTQLEIIIVREFQKKEFFKDI